MLKSWFALDTHRKCNMDVNSTRIESIDWRSVWPWLNIFRVGGIAAGPRKVLVAMLGLLTFGAGELLIGQALPFADQQNSSVIWVCLGDENQHFDAYGSTAALDLVGRFYREPLQSIDAARNWKLVVSPLESVLGPLMELFQADKSWSSTADAWTRLLWAVVVWSIFGGAITRMAATEFAANQKASAREALKFSTSKLLRFLTAPALPIAGIGCIWFACMIVGWIGAIPSVGENALGIGYGLTLLLGVAMSVMLIGVAAGWPLMVATIGVEASDGFDGLSRSYSYVINRPWYFAWSVFVSLVYGSIVIFVIWVVANLAVHLSNAAITTSLGSEAADTLLVQHKGIMKVASRPQEIGVTQEPVSVGTIVGFWLSIWTLGVLGFVNSYFWSATTAVYFTMRQKVDGISMKEVFLPPKPTAETAAEPSASSNESDESTETTGQ